MTEIVMDQTPPILQGPSEKERKYDRQLRLWAASGQAALESANILLVNSGAGTVGVETLKNLILPGIGRFVIHDNALVDEADFGVNFFLDDSCYGKPRAQCLASLLGELNPEVEGDWSPKTKDDSLGSLLKKSPLFTAIMYTYPINHVELESLEQYSKEHKTPLIAIHSTGFYSYFTVRLPGTFPIVDTHPDETATTDLRLLSPWPELVEFAKSMTKDIDGLDNFEHGHLPFVVILLYYLDQWKATHNGAYPSKYKEKTEFRQLVRDAARTDNPEGGEENFDEAAAAVLKTVTPSSLPSGLKEVFEFEHEDPIQERPMFWIIADAVKMFYTEHGSLPLPGNVPDMKAQSKVYVQLQNIYKTKARKDAAEVLQTAQAIAGAGREVDPAEVDLFCKNAAFVKLINVEGGGDTAPIGSKERLQQVLRTEMANDQMAEMTLQPMSLFPVYLALRGLANCGNASADKMQIVEAAKSLLSDDLSNEEYGDLNEKLGNVAEDLARAEYGELHNISALTGGMVAQEIIKIITKQYIPIDNTCVFDGIKSRTQVFRV
ncbi:hypothetical protein QBC32DRAFT_206174 [Pseudoneurospora amorphoporcata]|uniref:NEDD8-activating enzyme E1 regulatory subunit n=1 Tax=Pseudoneurospora amorphoporcata TaxID=241081 RepID=A0AAN6SJ10_9PEZI|nr:hypothetical protein QBC32DRAFT_206174 [Pseudoneurospora amorphoporcata]